MLQVKQRTNTQSSSRIFISLGEHHSFNVDVSSAYSALLPRFDLIAAGERSSFLLPEPVQS
jgi:hypothetical protein